MTDRPTPLTFDPYPWNLNGPGRSHQPHVMYPCDDGDWVKLEDYRDLERQRDHYLKQSASLIGKLAEMNIRRHVAESERDAYAETLREIDKSGMVGNVIRNRHPELAEEKP